MARSSMACASLVGSKDQRRAFISQRTHFANRPFWPDVWGKHPLQKQTDYAAGGGRSLSGLDLHTTASREIAVHVALYVHRLPQSYTTLQGLARARPRPAASGHEDTALRRRSSTLWSKRPDTS